MNDPGHSHDGVAAVPQDPGQDSLRPEDEDLALLCKALGHPARVRILRYLAGLDRCVCGGIVDLLPLAQSTVSQHLSQLKAAGLIRGKVEGPRVCYCLDREVLDRLAGLLAGLRPVAGLGAAGAEPCGPEEE